MNLPTRAPAPAGYSGTPLPKKLGIEKGKRVLLLDAPAGYREILVPLPDAVRFSTRAGKSVDIVQVFVTRRAILQRRLTALRAALRPDAAIWVSWPKRTSGVATDISEDMVRAVALPLGFVDVKVCAVDVVWSALKVVVRRELR